MKRNKIAERAIALSMLILPMVSCSEDTMDKINSDKNHPLEVSSKFILTDAMTAAALYSVAGDFSLYASIYMEHEVGIDNQTYNAEVRSGEPNLSATYNDMWNSLYYNMRGIKTAIAQCSEGGVEEGNDVTKGIAKVLYAHNLAMLTDLFGDAPFIEAAEYNEDGTPKFMQPNIDKQEDIYKAVMQNLDEALILLEGDDAAAVGDMGKQDLLYFNQTKGNIDQEKILWTKAIYAMKARYTMRLLSKSTDRTTTLNEILEYVSKSFTSADEELKYSVYQGDANGAYNPLFAFMYSRMGLGASQSLINKMAARKDPRLAQSFATDWDPQYGTPTKQVTDPATIKAAPNGKPVQGTMNYDTSIADWAVTAPTQIISYHEILFLKAEALCRLNRKQDAAKTLEEAITAGFSNLETTLNSTIYGWRITGKVNLSADVASTYFTESVKPLFDANPLKEVMVQKYLAFYGASGESNEAFSDYRRLIGMGEKDLIELSNPNNASKFPLRYGYGASDVQANMNLKNAFGDGQYVYSEPVWWAGGTR